MPEAPPWDIAERTFVFALQIIEMCRRVDDMPGIRRTIGRQLGRAGTSIGANVKEADEICRILGAIVSRAGRRFLSSRAMPCLFVFFLLSPFTLSI